MITEGQFKKVMLIDFGYATKYIDEYNNHLDKDTVDTFCGNLMFSSLD